MIHNQSSVVPSTTTINTAVRKPRASKPALSTSSFYCESEEDTRTQSSLSCTSPSSLFVNNQRQPSHHNNGPTMKMNKMGREVLANITNSQTINDHHLNKRQPISNNFKENPNCAPN